MLQGQRMLQMTPQFTAALADQGVVNGRFLSYTLPPVNPSFATITVTSVLPYFVSFDGLAFNINYPGWNDAGTYTVTVRLQNGMAYQDYSFAIKVYVNSLPFFKCSIEPVIAIPPTIITPFTYTLPAPVDYNSDVVSSFVTGLPIYGSYDPGTRTLSFAPPVDPDGTQFTISIYLNDGFNTTSPYNIDIVMSSSASPSFTGSFMDQTVKVGHVLTYQTPGFQNQGSAQVFMYVGSSASKNQALPSYINYDPARTEFTFSPGFDLKAATLTMMVVLSGGTYQQTSSSCFSLIITNDAPVTSTGFTISNQNVAVRDSISGVSQSYFIDIADPDGGPVSIILISTLPSYATVNGMTFEFKPDYSMATTSNVITFKVSDTIKESVDFSFTVNVINNGPTFNTPLVQQTVPVGTITTYSLDVSDPEGKPLTITASGTNSFIVLVGKTITISPPQTRPNNDAYTVTVTISDGVNPPVSQAFNVVIVNLPPIYTPLATIQTFRVLRTIVFTVPLSDPEGFPVKIISISGNQPHVSISMDQLSFTIAPPANLQDLDFFSYQFYISDGVNTVGPLTYSYKIRNDIPYYDPILSDQSVFAASMLVYKLPQYFDPEGNTIIQRLMSPLPIFVAFYSNSELWIMPNVLDTPSTHTITFELDDGGMRKSYSFSIIGKELPQLSSNIQNQVAGLLNIGPPYFITNLKASIEVIAGTTLEYQLPDIHDPDNDEFIINIYFGNAASFSQHIGQRSLAIHFSPVLSDVGKYTIKIQLKDLNSASQKTKQEQFDLLVVAPPKEQQNLSKNVTLDALEKAILSSNDSRSVNIKIVQISKRGRMLLNLQPPPRNFEFANSLTNQTVEIQVIPKKELPTDFDEGKLIIPFQVKQVDLNVIIYQLDMQYLNNIAGFKVSSSQFIDKIKLEINTTIWTKSKQGNEEVIYFAKKGFKSFAPIPPQIDETMQSVSDTVLQVVRGASYAILPANIIINILFAGLLSFLWEILEGLTQITVLSLISVTVPGIANDINRMLLGFAQLDVLPSALIEEQFLTFDDDNDRPLNENFELLGYEQMNSLRNMGSSFLYLIFAGALFIVILLVETIGKLFQITRSFKLLTFLKGIIQWNFFIRLILSQYLSFSLASLINIQEVRYLYHHKSFLQFKYDISGNIFATCATIFLLGTSIATPALFSAIIYQGVTRHTIETEEFQSMFGSLTERLRYKENGSNASLFLAVVDQMRTFLTVIVLTLLQEYPGVQIPALGFFSLWRQIYIVIAKPFESMKQNGLQLFNECLLSLYIYMLILLTDYNDSEKLKEIASFSLVSITALYVIINFGHFLLLVFHQTKHFIKRKCRKSKLQKIEGRYSAKPGLDTQEKLFFENSSKVPVSKQSIELNLDNIAEGCTQQNEQTQIITPSVTPKRTLDQYFFNQRKKPTPKYTNYAAEPNLNNGDPKLQGKRLISRALLPRDFSLTLGKMDQSPNFVFQQKRIMTEQ